MFEKFAEMNNKYDVKNFSDLIDQFKIEDEMKIINDYLKEDKLNSTTTQTPLPGCLFDPKIDNTDR